MFLGQQPTKFKMQFCLTNDAIDNNHNHNDYDNQPQQPRPRPRPPWRRHVILEPNDEVVGDVAAKGSMPEGDWHGIGITYTINNEHA